ncbi:MAG: CDP-alcohol phosphatidyltransferase family protein [Acidimicrobiia bacterium]
MTQEQVSDRILTIPNLVSFTRLAAIPVFWWLLLAEDNITAATILFALIATTDWIDGYLARRLNQVSKLGKSLDPIADRLMIFSAVVAGLIAGIIPPVIGITLIVREVYMALVTAALVLRGKGVLEVRYLGKVATFGVYSSIGWFYMAEIPFLEWLTRPLAWGVGVFSLILYWITAFQYTGDARRVMSQLESGPVPEES